MKKMKTLSNPGEKGMVWVLAAVVFLAMVPINLLTPMFSDDYAYCFSFADGRRIETLGQVFKSQYAHYQTMNGRVILHTLVQISFMLPSVILRS